MPEINMKLSITTALSAFALLASTAKADDVYSHFAAGPQKLWTELTQAHYDVSNTGCFSVEDPIFGWKPTDVFFSQGSQSPNMMAHGPYCLTSWIGFCDEKAGQQEFGNIAVGRTEYQGMFEGCHHKRYVLAYDLQQADSYSWSPFECPWDAELVAKGKVFNTTEPVYNTTQTNRLQKRC